MMDEITREIHEQIKLISDLERELRGIDNQIEAGEISPDEAEKREKEIESQIKEARREKYKLDQEKHKSRLKAVHDSLPPQKEGPKDK